MKKTIWPGLLLCLLLALPSWGATWTVSRSYLGADSTAIKVTGSITRAIALATTGDNVVWGESFTSGTNENITINKVIHFNTMGFDVVAAGTSTYFLRFTTTSTGSSIEGSGEISGSRSTGMISLANANASDVTISGVTISNTGGPCIYQDAATGLTLDGVTFNAENLALSSNAGLAGFSAVDCIVNSAAGFLVKGVSGSVENCTFTGCDGYGSGSTLIGKGIYLSTGSLDISGCTFSGCDIGIYLGAGSNGDNVVSGNSFYQCYTYCVFVEGPGTSTDIHHNLFGEIASSNLHFIMCGHDDATDNETVFPLTIHDNTFNIEFLNDEATLTNIHLHVLKAAGVKVYNERAVMTRAFTVLAGDNFSFVTSKGCKSGFVYNNYIDVPYMAVLKYNTQGSTSSRGIVASNNFATDRCETFVRAIFTANIDAARGHSWESNCVGSLGGYNEETSSAFSLTSLDGWGTTNFADSTSWRLKWGGKTGLTGIIANSFGGVNVGINPATGTAATGMSEPYIWPSKHGAELEIDRVAGTPAELAALITANVLPKSDTLDVDTWYRLPQPRSFAEESMCRAYVSTWREMAAATRDLMTFRVSGAKYLLQHPDVANVEGPWALHELIRYGGATDEAHSVADDITTWIELPQARNAADRIQAEIYLRVWQQWPGGKSGAGVYSQRDSIFYKVDGLSSMTLTRAPDDPVNGVYQLIADIDGHFYDASTATDITTWFKFDPIRNDAEMLRSEIHLAQWEMLATDDKAKIRLRTK